MALLDVIDLKAGYGKIEILHGISISLESGTLCGVIGEHEIGAGNRRDE